VLVVADTSPLISLAVIDKLDILDKFFPKLYLPAAVWQEISAYAERLNIPQIKRYKTRVRNIKNAEASISFMDRGEAEAIVLCREMKADYLLLDDKKARLIAETLGFSCVGTLAVLLKAKKEKLISNLRPLFRKLLKNKRYYSVELLNALLMEHGEKNI
jgi:predicted nucleic acid-binding protein